MDSMNESSEVSERRGRPRIALVLAGGGARGAYEVGVVRYILQELPKRLGRDVPIQILCGTSVGAINVCLLAAFADAPQLRATLLVERWRALELEHILRPDPLEFVMLARELVGARPKPILGKPPRGGLVDPAGLTKVLTDAIPFERIDGHFAAGRLHAASVSTTHVGTGRTVVFVQHEDQLRWGTHPTMIRRSAKLRLDHALASAAIPIVFPAVSIDGDLYCDGGLRQNVPLSPARRMGADRLLVVNPHYIATKEPDEHLAREREEAFAGPAFLLGKTLNALLLDRLDGDVERLNHINDFLAAGVREYGPAFIPAINRQLGVPDGQTGLRELRTTVIRASEDIGRLCGDFVRGPAFERSRKGLTGRALRRLARSEGMEEADLLSYIMFDGEFASELISLGEADARAYEDEMCELFEDAVR